MIKFFRKIRQKLLTENKFSKYLLYAFGEIILVVIGILIALNINNRNIEHQKEVKMETLFESMLNEFETDIVKVNDVLETERIKDSLFTIILNGDLKQNDVGVVFRVMSYSALEISDIAFNNLVNNIDEIPKKYKEIYEGLNILHIQIKPKYLMISEKLESFFFEELQKWTKTKPWYYKINSRNVDGLMEYALNDPLFKNFVFRSKQTLGNKINALERYNYQASRSYIEIHKILKKKNELPDFITSDFRYLSTDKLQKYEGLFEYKKNPKTKIKITSKEGFLFVEYEWTENTNFDFFPKTDLEFNYGNNRKLFFNKSSNGDILGFTEEINKVKYIYLRSE